MEVKSLNGKIESKAQKQDKNKKDFWKFEIGGKTYNWFKYEEGQGFNVGDEVNITYEENQVGDRTYKNIKSMGKGYSSMSDQALSDTHTKVEKEMGGGSPQSISSTSSTPSLYPKVSFNNEGARTGMLFRCAVELCIAQKKPEITEIEKWFNSLKTLLNQLEAK